MFVAAFVLKKLRENSEGEFGVVSDNAVVDAFKLILFIYNNFSIVKKVVNKIVRVK